MGRLALGLVLAGLLAGCTAAVVLRSRATGIDDYPAVRVRLYRLGLGMCRVDILTATETIQTGPARCDVVPHRAIP